MEQLLLGRGLSRDKLHVVEQQNVHFSVLVAEFVGALFLNGRHQLVGESLRGDVHDALFREMLNNILSHSVHQVGFPQTGTAVKEEGVVLLYVSLIRDGEAGGQRQLVVGTLHKAFEGISGVEPVILFFRDRAAAFVIIIGRLRVDDLQLIFFPEGLDQRFGKKLLVIVDAILIDAAFGSGGLQVDGLLLFAQFDRGQRAEERIHF